MAGGQGGSLEGAGKEWEGHAQRHGQWEGPQHFPGCYSRRLFIYSEAGDVALASVSSVFITSPSASDRRPSSPTPSLPFASLQGRAEGGTFLKRHLIQLFHLPSGKLRPREKQPRSR